MMVNIMGQLDWAIGYSDIQLNIILSILVMMCLNQINIYINILSKADRSP